MKARMPIPIMTKVRLSRPECCHRNVKNAPENMKDAGMLLWVLYIKDNWYNFIFDKFFNSCLTFNVKRMLRVMKPSCSIEVSVPQPRPKGLN